eukprot:PhF_6_TR21890/c0_g1_i1/m.31086/K03932/lpqC; polyhydroxybutyrate depolymerase
MIRSLLIAVAIGVALGSGACPNQGIPSGQITSRSIQRPEGTREYRVYVPTNYKNTAPVPLVYSFHGLNDNCDNFITATGLNTYADSVGYILVAPCGSFGLLGVGWNSGTCCGFSADSPDDVAFTRAILADIQANLCINPGKIFSTGFSNGAMMSEILGCVASDIFSAVVSVSGVVELRPGNSDGLTACDTAYAKANRNTGVLNVHGNLDFLVPWTGDALLGFPDIPTDMADWAKREGCTTGPTQTFSRGAFSNQVWTGCKGGKIVELVKNNGGGHTWPMSKDFDTTTYIVDFLFNRTK